MLYDEYLVVRVWQRMIYESSIYSMHCETLWYESPRHTHSKIMTVNHGQRSEAGSRDNAYGDDERPEKGEDAYRQRSNHYSETDVLTVERAREATVIEHKLTVKEAFRLVWKLTSTGILGPTNAYSTLPPWAGHFSLAWESSPPVSIHSSLGL